MATKTLKLAPSEDLTSIDEVASNWEVTSKTITKWTDIIYLAFDARLPKNGPFPLWGVAMLDLVGKHISQKASFYFAETQEARRLQATEFIRKIRHLRQEGHFQEFQQFQKFQKPEQPLLEEEQDDELEALVELTAIAERQDQQLFNAQRAFEAREDEQIEQLATFIEQSDNRRMGKLAKRLQQRQLEGTATDQALDVSFRRLPGS